MAKKPSNHLHKSGYLQFILCESNTHREKDKHNYKEDDLANGMDFHSNFIMVLVNRIYNFPCMVSLWNQKEAWL